MRYYYSKAGTDVQGPVDEADLWSMIRSGALPPSTRICLEGSEEWQPAPISVHPPQSLPGAPPAVQKRPPPPKGCQYGCGGCFVLLLLGFVFSTIKTPIAPSTPSLTESPLERVHRLAPYATREDGREAARKTTLTGNIEPLIDTYRNMGYSESFINGYRDGVRENAQERNR